MKGALTLAELPRAYELQPMTDPTEGSWTQLTYGAAINLGGLHVHGERLLVNVYRHYDADGNQPSSHWSRNLDLTRGGRLYRPGDAGRDRRDRDEQRARGQRERVHGRGAARVAGALPRAVLHGQSGIPIVSRTCWVRGCSRSTRTTSA